MKLPIFQHLGAVPDDFPRSFGSLKLIVCDKTYRSAWLFLIVLQILGRSQIPLEAGTSDSGWVFSVPRLVFSLPVVFPFPRLVFSVPVVFLVPRSWCFQFLDWCFPCPAPVLVFLVPRFGCFQSWTMCSLPGSCVGVPFHVFVCQLSFEFLATIAHRWI